MYVFKRWKTNAKRMKDFRRYDEWCQNQEDLNSEKLFAEKYMEPIYYCWKCKYSECDVHN